LNSWVNGFDANERQDGKEDLWAEYQNSELQDFMKYGMLEIIDDCRHKLQQERSQDPDYSAIKLELSRMLVAFGYMPLNAMEDSIPEEEQLAVLKQFKTHYLEKADKK